MPGNEKEYGLILPNKQKEISKPAKRVLNPLATSDDELEKEEGESLNWVEASLKKSAGNSGQQSLQKRLLREAVEEDSTVFQYDEVYDDIKASQQEEKERKTQQLAKKPKYIETILKQSEKRKLENERRLERKVQKEREAEGSEFADKESFVTPSYLKKLEELKNAEEAEQREKLIEEKIDVHKHKNFGVFYNHLFKQRIGEKEIKQEPDDSAHDSEQPGTSTESNKSQTQPKNYRTQHDLSDEEATPGEHLNIQIKKEAVTSSSSDDESPDESKEDKANKFINKKNNNSLFKQKSQNKERNIRHRSTSRDRSDSKYRKRESENADKKYRDKSGKNYRYEIEKSRNLKRHRSKSKEKSKDRNRDRSRDKDRREESKERSGDGSRGRDRRNRSKERNRNRSIDRERRDRSKERSKQRSRDKRERSESRDRKGRSKSRDNRERSRSRDKKEGSKSTDKKRSRSGSSDKKEKQDHDGKEPGKRSKRSRSKDKIEDKHEDSKGKLPEKDVNEKERETNDNNNKENCNTENGDAHDRINVSAKQSINTKLGTTDVNKMKIKDRIKRFRKIFAKRTVNETFESAVRRYFQRKSEAGSSGLA